MKQKQIIILGAVLGLALVGLIIIQTRYFQTAFKLRKAQFDFVANRALLGIIEDIEEKDRFYDLKQEAEYPATNERVDQNGTEANNVTNGQAIDLMDYDEEVKNGDQIFRPTDDAGLKKSLSRYRKARKGQLGGTEIKTDFVVRDYSFLKRSVEDRLKEIDVQRIIEDRLKGNGISDVVEYAVKEHDRFVFMSPGFFNKHSDYVYSAYIFLDNAQADTLFYLIFPEKKQSVTSSLMLLLPNIVVTLILILCFGFCLVVIIRQKKLSVIKNDFINNMTHEFKTPIATISLAAQMLKDKAVQQTPDTIDHVAGIVWDESKRLTFQVEKVLQTALFTESRMKLKLKPLNINELIESLLVKFELRVEDKKGKLIGHLDAENDEVSADEVHITNVISNLLDNAIKYCVKVPEISVYTRNRGDEIIISVVDNGIGIAAKEQKLIFERFYRVSTGNLHDVKGFGLGLSYVKMIIDAHNGKIEVESTLDKGSRFDIVLPLTSKKQKTKKTLSL
ncbi:HAMP domain-containing histidine kinase [Porphyromonadaceae bacterium OttesenSCG-928-L07]|nr:HAMP domain-containing histidine kinase [Porphyromonadaceae bacterium OttesenSCG-928-L07]MDL2252308.1 HAMP domain-containing histidine kinase [Odoribacter sp. OttesenSCG-928-J03]MDL2330568.1 HAMP domain-containing histidine kinase [Odoribacter sp. OttesenSCG-928-A06]